MPAHRIPAAQLVPAGEIEPMPAKLEPMHAESGDAPFNAPDWMWEPKLDGYRVLAFIGGKDVKLRSRRGLELAPLVSAAGRRSSASRRVNGMILDGEIVAFDAAGRPSFNALQNRVQLKTRARAGGARTRARRWSSTASICCYFAGVDLRKSPYRDRRRYLSQCLLPSPLVRWCTRPRTASPCTRRRWRAASKASSASARTAATSPAGARRTWLKIKPTLSADFVVGGYTRGKGSRAPLGALLVGYWDGRERGSSTIASHVGSGFDDRTLAQVMARLEAAREKDLSVRGEAGAAQSDHLGGAAARGRGQVPELDRGRSACARRCSCGCATTWMRRT